jgi:hypothetical protein
MPSEELPSELGKVPATSLVLSTSGTSWSPDPLGVDRRVTCTSPLSLGEYRRSWVAPAVLVS